MADALCGPSNSLQQFKQQTSLDRTLQQDRLSSRHSPAQGFRSHDPNAGLLDPEFEAFQAGIPAPDLPQYQPFHQQQQPAFAGAPQQPSWAADFQHMHISPPPFQRQQHVSQAGPQSSAWAQGFREHIAQNAPRAQQTSSPSPQAFQQRARYGYNGFQSNFAQQPGFAPTMQSKGKEPMSEQFDEAAFERAFDQAKDDMMTDVHNPHPITDEQDAHNVQVLTAFAQGAGNVQESRPVDISQFKYAPMVESLSNTAHTSMQDKFTIIKEANQQFHLDEVDAMAMDKQQEEQAQHDQRGEDDALAATAQELLEKVEHNKSDKFRNSQFLTLMRKLRDREVKVEGDKMVETTATAESQQTLTDASSSMQPLFDNTEQRPSPLATGAATRPFGASVVDTRPPDYGIGIPEHEQDHDTGRVNLQDGQEVVELLNQPDALDVEADEVGEDLGFSAQQSAEREATACKACKINLSTRHLLAQHQREHDPATDIMCPLPGCGCVAQPGRSTGQMHGLGHLMGHVLGPRNNFMGEAAAEWPVLESAVMGMFGEGKEGQWVLGQLAQFRDELREENESFDRETMEAAVGGVVR